MKNSTVQKNLKNIPALRFPGFLGEWEEKKLEDMLTMVVDNRGKTPPVGSTGIPLLEVNSLGKKNVDFSRVSKYVNEETYKNWFRKHLQKKDILFSTVGATALCSFYDDDKKAAVAQNIVGLRFCKDDPCFVYYLLTERKNNHRFKRIEMGAVQPSVKVSQMIKIKFLLPSLPEQKKIAEFLGSVDEWISNLRAQKESLEKFKKGMMQKIFSQEIRFKDKSGKNFPYWEEKKLGEVAIFLKGKGLSKDDILKNGKNECIHYGELFTKYNETITNIISFTNVSKEKSVLSIKNDILMPTSDVTPNGLATVSALNESGIILGGDILIIRSKKILNTYFSYYVNAHRKDIMKLVSGVTVYHIYGSDLKSLEVNLPTWKEQEKIAEFLTSIDNLIESKQRQVTLVEKWKKGFMQGLFV